MKHLTDKQLRDLNRDTERRESGASWLMEVIIWVGTVAVLIFCGLCYMERHGMLCGTPNP